MMPSNAQVALIINLLIRLCGKKIKEVKFIYFGSAPMSSDFFSLKRFQLVLRPGLSSNRSPIPSDEAELTSIDECHQN